MVFSTVANTCFFFKCSQRRATQHRKRLRIFFLLFQACVSTPPAEKVFHPLWLGHQRRWELWKSRAGETGYTQTTNKSWYIYIYIYRKHIFEWMQHTLLISCITYTKRETYSTIIAILPSNLHSIWKIFTPSRTYSMALPFRLPGIKTNWDASDDPAVPGQCRQLLGLEKQPVDGKNPTPVEVGSLSHYLQGLVHPGWFSRRISEPSPVLEPPFPFNTGNWCLWKTYGKLWTLKHARTWYLCHIYQNIYHKHIYDKCIRIKKTQKPLGNVKLFNPPHHMG